MSIYGSWPAPSGDEHADDCARWEKHPGSWEISDRPCDCGQPDAPLVYQGSHHLPEETDARGGFVDLASIAPHVRFWRDHPDALTAEEPELPHEPFLRFGVNEGTVVLTRRHVEAIVDSLTEWLKTSEDSPVSAADPRRELIQEARESHDVYDSSAEMWVHRLADELERALDQLEAAHAWRDTHAEWRRISELGWPAAEAEFGSGLAASAAHEAVKAAHEAAETTLLAALSSGRDTDG